MKTTGKLEKDLKTLALFKKNAKSQLALIPSQRNYAWLKEFFGVSHTIEPDDIHKKITDIGMEVERFAAVIETKMREAAPSTTHLAATDNPSTTLGSAPNPLIPEPLIQSPTEFNLRPDSIFKPVCSRQKARLTTQESHGCEQLATAQIIFDNIWYDKARGQQLIAPPGSGKTFVYGSVVANLTDHGFYADCLSPWPALIVTRASIVDQTKEVLSELFGLDIYGHCQVINVEMLRAALVGTLIHEETEVVNGDPRIIYKWFKGYRPRTIFYDESHSLMRPDSLQSQVANALYSNEDEAMWETYELDISATPWSRLMEAKHFALSTHMMVKLNDAVGVEYTTYISPTTWPIISREICEPYTVWKKKDGEVQEVSAGPEDYCPEAIRDFVDIMKSRIIWIKNVEPKHKGYLDLLPIDLDRQDLIDEYNNAIENHNKRQASINANEEWSAAQKEVALLASYTILGKAAENCKRYYISHWIWEQWQNGFAPAFGFIYKQTALSVIKILFNDFNWTRDDISIIWGGATESLSAKKKLAKKIAASSEAQELIAELDMDLTSMGIFLNEVHTKTEEEVAWEKANNLHAQKPEERDKEKKRFLRQATKLAAFSYKAGGVGLSLHHEAQYPKARPRRGLYTPDYSEKMSIQAFGRLPRLTSASDTYMWLCYLRGTIEVEKVAKFKMKAKSLKEVTRSNEAWSELIEDDRGALSMVSLGEMNI